MKVNKTPGPNRLTTEFYQFLSQDLGPILLEWLKKLVCFFGFLTSSPTARLYRGQVPRLTFDNFMCCHTWNRVGRPWPLSQPVTLYWHRPNQYGAAGHSEGRTRDLITRSRALYRLSSPTPSRSTQNTNTIRQPLIIIYHTPAQRQPRQDTNEKLQTHLTCKRRLQDHKQSHHQQTPTPHVKSYTRRSTILNRRKKNTKPLTSLAYYKRLDTTIFGSAYIVNTTILSRLIYPCTILKTPETFLKEINREITNFIFQGTLRNTKDHTRPTQKKKKEV